MSTIPAIANVPLSAILMDAGIQCRAAINTETVTGYAERMAARDEFPPVDLFGTDGRYWIGDGWHRIMAATHVGADSIRATVHDGGRHDALKHALGANAKHGHRRSNADKRRCVEIALSEFPTLSSRAIAELCGVSHVFVEGMKPKVETVTTCQAEASTVTGADGKQYPAKKKPKDEPPPEAQVEPLPNHMPTSQKAERIKALLDKGHNIEQIADLLGLSVGNTRRIIHLFGIATVQRKGRGAAKIDSARVVRETVNAAFAMCQGLRLIPKGGVEIEPIEATALLADLREATKTLKTLEQLLKGLSNEKV